MEVMKLFGLSTFCGGFKSSKCKTTAKLATARIKLLRNKREVVVTQMRRDIAMLLQSKQDATARIRVEHVIREQNIMAANEIIELFCELVVARLTIIAKQRECPADLKEGISSLIFASPRCSDIPELLQLRDIFEKKYGKDFVSAATELRPSCGVNRTLIEKLSVRTPTGEVKLKFMKEIAKEYQIEWDPAESEKELLKLPGEPIIEGPNKFVSSASMPVKPVSSSQDNKLNQSANRFSNDKEAQGMNYLDAAAQSAEKAVAAAQVAAYLANRNTHQLSQTTGYSNNADGLNNPLSIKNPVPGNLSGQSVYEGPRRVNTEDPYYLGNTHHVSQTTGFSNRLDGISNNTYVHRNSTGSSQLSDSPVDSQDRVHHSVHPGNTYESQSFNWSQSNEQMNQNNLETKRVHRRHSYKTPTHSDVKFDESDGSGSDYDEKMELETPPGEMHPTPDRPPPPVPSHANQSDDRTQVGDSHPYRRHSLPRIHPKLPDYDELSSRFEALKFRKP